MVDLLTPATKNARFHLLSTRQRKHTIRKWLARIAQQASLARELRTFGKHLWPDGITPDGFVLDEVDWMGLAGFFLKDRV